MSIPFYYLILLPLNQVREYFAAFYCNLKIETFLGAILKEEAEQQSELLIQEI